MDIHAPLSQVVEWRHDRAPVPYPAAVESMETRIADIHAGRAAQMVWLLEHPPLYTAGTSADPAELLDGGRFPVYPTGRGGRYTYHGPGQRVVYVMLDLRRGPRDVRRFVHGLEEWMILTLAEMGVTGERRTGRIGIWVAGPGGAEAKVGAIGVRIRKWITFHGMALNVDPDLSHFAGIVPCGIAEHGVTSLRDLGVPATMDQVDAALHATFDRALGEVAGTMAPAGDGAP
ncbi:MAG: lipoyl(octanoyl) transferase LipB [Hyphomicrobiales bacterium]|nr:lipoyl(octanoyl) transferase LipB [Hyphomicrobiales bacterium]MCP5373914.1 lipoyl(octanoyl) transferase LipB [Hyphomicrobiales bacterium]